MKNEAIEFAKWIANYKSKCEHGSTHEDFIELIEGNWLWKDDEDGSYPLTEEQLYKMFKNEKLKFHYTTFPEIDPKEKSFSIEVGVVIDGEAFEGYYEFERGVWYVHFGGDTFGHKRMDADEIEKWFYLNKTK